jgi:hypothetical protein
MEELFKSKFDRTPPLLGIPRASWIGSEHRGKKRATRDSMVLR